MYCYANVDVRLAFVMSKTGTLFFVLHSSSLFSLHNLVFRIHLLTVYRLVKKLLFMC